METRIEITKEELVMIMTGPFFAGFTAQTCENCNKVSNVIVGDNMWKCPGCESPNALPVRWPESAVKKPDYGPSMDDIQSANIIARDIRISSWKEHHEQNLEQTED